MEEMGWTQKQTASYFNNKGYGNWVSQMNISHWLKDWPKLEMHVGDGGINPTTCCMCSVQYPELEAALVLWVEQQEARGLTIKGGLIKMKAERIGNALNIQNLRLSDGWLASFKEWHMLQDQRMHGEAGSARLKDADAREGLDAELGGRDPKFLFNCDETSFFWQAFNNHGLSTKAIPGKKLDKSWISVLVITNATGTRRICLLFIANEKQPQCFKKKTARQWGFWYFHNKKAWMTNKNFATAMEVLNAEFRGEGIHALMLLDNFSGHK